MTTSSRRALLCGVAALPALTLPALAGPSDLARACDAAIAHRHWIDAVGWGAWEGEEGDDLLTIECDKVSAVKQRCAVENSATLSDLAAKARLALDDYEMFQPEPKQHDQSDRLYLAIFRDVVRLCGEGV